MCVRKRMYVSLLSLMSVCSLFVLSGALAARTHHKDPVRTPLPTDNALSVYVGVRANWQSLINSALAPVANEFSADVSAYDLVDTPTYANLADHEFVSEPLPDNSDWYMYKPTTDTFNLTFNIADTSNRLGKIVVSDLLTGQVLGSVNAAADGSAIQGQVSISWQQPVYRIEGYDKNNASLFRLGASNGFPDQIGHFMVPGAFTPYRPATVSSARFAGGEDVAGVVGDPESAAGVSVSAQAGASRGCAALDQVNDAPGTVTMVPPAPFWRYKKNKCIEFVDPTVYRSENPVDQATLASDILAAEQEDPAFAMSSITQVPYSDSTGHWDAVFTGRVKAVFVVPYRVAKQNSLSNFLKSTFGFLAMGTQGKANDKWAFGLFGAFVTWLSSDSGKQSGLKAGMVIPLGDIKTLQTQELRKDTPIILGLFDDVTFTLAPDIAPPSGMGYGRIEMATPLTTPPPPPIMFASNLTFSSPGWTYTTKLSKGYRYKVSGNILSPPGYQPVNQPVEFSLPGSNAVSIPCTLTVLLQLKIYTVSASNPAGPRGLNVQVKNAAGQLVGGGMSQMQEDGKYAITTPFLPPGNYTVSVDQSDSGGKWSGSMGVMVQRGLLQETTVTATFAPNPPPPHP